MALPHNKITPIPNNEPDATPSLWNTRYQEINENFQDLDDRSTSVEGELRAAKGDSSTLAQKISAIENLVSSQSADYQDMQASTVMFALQQVQQANQMAQAFKEQIQQEGVVTLENRGVIRGCSISKSSGAARNLNLTSGKCFSGSYIFDVSEKENAASVPSNTGPNNVTVFAYLHRSADYVWRLGVTAVGETVPEGAIRIYNITVPPGSTDITDPTLSGVQITDVRRFEPNYPNLIQAPAMVSPAINRLSSNDYHMDFQVVESDGPCDESSIEVYSQAPNGFTIRLASPADNVIVRWRISKLNN